MIDKETVKKMAELARVEVDNQEDLPDQLSKIIEYVDKLKEVNVEGVEPMRGLDQGSSKELVREDQVKKDSAREEILKNAPALTDDFFRVPRVIK